MSKVAGSTVQAGDLPTILKTPEQQLQGNVPQASDYDNLPDTLEAPATTEPQGAPAMESPSVSPAMGEGALGFGVGEFDAINQEQMDAEQADINAQRVTPFTEREQAQEVTSWEYKKPTYINDNSGDGGFTSRIEHVASMVANPEVTAVSKGSNLGKVASLMGAAYLDPITNQLSEVDGMLKMMVAAQAEKFFADRLAGAKGPIQAVTPQSASEKAAEALIPETEIKKAENSADLGQEINREYQRIKNAQQGVETDSYMDLPVNEATLLGDYAKEIYAHAMGDKIQRMRDPEDPTKVIFSLTPAMISELDSAKAYRDIVLPKQIIDPLTAPPETGRIQGEKGEYVKDIAGKIGKGVITSSEIEEAIKNLSSIPNVVDRQRLRILITTMLPALMSNPQGYSNPLVAMYAEINGFGTSKVKQLTATQKQKGEGSTYNWFNEMGKYKNNLAQQLYGIAKGRNQANYLTYYLQAFSGRLAPQQSLFDPTTSKAVRFVTRNAVPTVITKDGKYFQTAIQAYALLIGDKVNYNGKDIALDAFLPENRVAFMRNQAPRLEAWGKKLQAAMANGMTDEQVEAVAAAIAQGMSVNDPNFPRFQGLQLDPNTDAELIQAITKRGEDGLAYIDALIDFAKFSDAMRQGKSYKTYINPTIDGKTNGPASNGLQMGDRKMATRTGVIRSEDAVHAVEGDYDIRDELKDILLQSITEGYEGKFKDPQDHSVISELAKIVYSHRDLNKQITMTYGYGKEMESFVNAIVESMYLLAEDSKNAAEAMGYLKEQGYLDNEVAQVLLSKYIPAMTQVMSKEGMEARALMRGVGLIHSMADTTFEINGSMGLRHVMGGYVPEENVSVGSYKIEGQERKARLYKGRPTAAAPKMRTDKEGNPVRDIGGRVWGGSVVAPVQALDAATVVKTLSGDTWKKLNHDTHGHPYIHQIYDAFKFDVATFHLGLKEVNRNWAELGLSWSYLEQAKIALRKRGLPALREMVSELDPKVTYNLADFPQIADLLTTSVTQSGNVRYSNLIKKLMALAPSSLPSKFANKREWAEATANKLVDSAGLYASDTITRKQMGIFIKGFLDATQIESRLSRLYKHTEQKRAKLRQEVLASDNAIYQYYAH